MVLLVEWLLGGDEVWKKREGVMLETHTHTIDDGTRRVECQNFDKRITIASELSRSHLSKPLQLPHP